MHLYVHEESKISLWCMRYSEVDHSYYDNVVLRRRYFCLGTIMRRTGNIAEEEEC